MIKLQKKLSIMKDLIFKVENSLVKLTCLKEAAQIIDLLPDNSKYCVVADADVIKLHKNFTDLLVERGYLIFEVSAAEKNKSIETYTQIIDFMQKNEMKRSDRLLGLGGGAITDLAGFVASTYMRGIQYFQIPTSLLAQVDASIGGKTGINHGHIKNFIGSFYNPAEVFICSEFLKTLNEQEFLNGFSEVLKHSLITSQQSLEKLKERAEKILSQDTEVLLECIEESIEIKAQVVASDFKESGVRKYLNFGHTFAHGIESINDSKPIFHGHAVTIGMQMALGYSHQLGFLKSDSYKLAMNTICEFNYDFSDIALDANRIFEAMKSDKKNTKTMNLVLLKDIGHPFIYEEHSNEILKDYINKFIHEFKK